jgi:hypothetical protein
LKIEFLLIFNFHVYASWYCQNCLISGVVDTSKTFISGVVDTAEQFFGSVVHTGDKFKLFGYIGPVSMTLGENVHSCH